MKTVKSIPPDSKVYVDVQFKMFLGKNANSKNSVDDVVKERRKVWIKSTLFSTWWGALLFSRWSFCWLSQLHLWLIFNCLLGQEGVRGSIIPLAKYIFFLSCFYWIHYETKEKSLKGKQCCMSRTNPFKVSWKKWQIYQHPAVNDKCVPGNPLFLMQ